MQSRLRLWRIRMQCYGYSLSMKQIWKTGIYSSPSGLDSVPVSQPAKFVGFGLLISINMMVVPSQRHQIYRLLDPALRSPDFLSLKYYSPPPCPWAYGAWVPKRAATLAGKVKQPAPRPLDADHVFERKVWVCKIDLTPRYAGVL